MTQLHCSGSVGSAFWHINIKPVQMSRISLVSTSNGLPVYTWSTYDSALSNILLTVWSIVVFSALHADTSLHEGVCKFTMVVQGALIQEL